MKLPPPSPPVKQPFDKVYNSLKQLLDKIHNFYFVANWQISWLTFAIVWQNSRFFISSCWPIILLRNCLTKFIILFLNGYINFGINFWNCWMKLPGVSFSLDWLIKFINFSEPIDNFRKFLSQEIDKLLTKFPSVFLMWPLQLISAIIWQNSLSYSKICFIKFSILCYDHLMKFMINFCNCLMRFMIFSTNTDWIQNFYL